MRPPNATDDFREQMSAWHDDALPPEAGRFVARRVLGEVGLRAELGRWQLVGDVLRRQAVARPPADLASRIAQALPEPRRMPWAGALVAGVALFGLFLLPPAGPPMGDATATLASAASMVAPAAGPQPGRAAPVEPPLRAAVVVTPVVAEVPVLVRAPQPSPEKLAPLPPSPPLPEPPARPWPRGDGAATAFVVDYRMVPPPDGR